MSLQRLARLEGRLRPILLRLPPSLAVALYSAGRRRFLKRLAQTPPARCCWQPPAALLRTLWGLPFRQPLGNGAGMFKNGDGYPLALRQGAGWYLAGTTTGQRWMGNRQGWIRQPFLPYPRSAAASNWLGLPNDSSVVVAARLAPLTVEPVADRIPIGASVAATPGVAGEGALAEVVEGMENYQEAGVDFLEINESCPNTGEGRPQDTALASRLGVIAERFLERRSRPLPVVVKLSCDTPVEQVPDLVDLLTEMGFDGLNFGNTSVRYDAIESQLDRREKRLFRYFTERFGGGVSGAPLQQRALALVAAAAERLRVRPAAREFHLLCTGGIATAADLRKALAAGASLCGWYTGYFEAFARHGHALYREFWSANAAEGEKSRKN